MACRKTTTTQKTLLGSFSLSLPSLRSMSLEDTCECVFTPAAYRTCTHCHSDVSQVHTHTPTAEWTHCLACTYSQNPDGSRTGVSRNNLLLRGCVLRNTRVVGGVVVYAGEDRVHCPTMT